MNMSYRKAGIMFLVAFLIQTSFLNLVIIRGYTPHLLLCLVVVLSFLYENQMYGVVFGAIFGVLYDICFSSCIGPTGISLVIVGIVILILREYTNIESILNLWIVSTVSIFLYYALNWGLFHLAGNPIGFMYVLKKLPGEYIYSFAVITILYFILIRKAARYRTDRYFR